MNIFFLAWCFNECASYYSDKHVVKIILEIAQMLYTAHHVLGGCELPENAYRSTHPFHPMSVWVRTCKGNYIYACILGKELCAEYTKRYKKTHATESHIEWLSLNMPAFDDLPESKKAKTETVFADSPIKGLTPIPLCMPKIYHCDDAIQSYRNYYQGEDKTKINRWKHSQVPEWYNPKSV